MYYFFSLFTYKAVPFYNENNYNNDSMHSIALIHLSGLFLTDASKNTRSSEYD